MIAAIGTRILTGITQAPSVPGTLPWIWMKQVATGRKHIVLCEPRLTVFINTKSTTILITGMGRPQPQ